MRHSTRLKCEDVRALLRLAGELHELPDAPAARVEHMLRRTCELVDARIGFANIFKTTAGHVDLVWAAQWGTLDRDGHEAMWRLAELGMEHQGPVFNAAVTRVSQVQTLAREQLVGDSEWYRSTFFNEHPRLAGLDHPVAIFHPLPRPGYALGIGVFRAVGEGRFGPRVWAVLDLLNEEFGWFYRSVADLAGGSRHTLPRRLRRTLERLLAGDSEKQVARHLGLSPHTIHEYVKALHRHYGVSSRGELLAAVYGRTNGREH